MFCMWEYYNEKWAPYLPVLKEAMNLTFERSINLLETVTSSNMSQLLDTDSDSEVSAIQRCPLFRCVRYSEMSAIQRFSHEVLH